VEALEEAGLDPVRVRDLPYGVQLRLHSQGQTCRVNVYFSRRKGLSLVAAGGSPDLADRALAAVSAPLPDGAWIGSDEAGKGDFLGGLAVCALCCPAGMGGALRRLGARDSKGMSREAVRRVAADIRESGLFPFSLELMEPADYNLEMERLRSRGRNSHDLLAAMHGRAISALLADGCRAVEVIVDRFCRPARLRPHLPDDMPPLSMRVRGESDPAVAAAAILARQAYMDGLARLSAEYAVDLTPGAGPPADRAASTLVRIHGADSLQKVAKMHVRNAKSLV
jgi:ribonuclease HIII